MGPGGILEPSWSHLVASWAAGAFLEASWKAPGSLLEASGDLQGRLETARGIGFSHLRGQKAAEMEAKRVQNGVEEATRAENTISSKTVLFLQQISSPFEVPGPLF